MINLERGARIYPYVAESAIVKIIPAPENLYARSKHDGTNKYVYSPIVCLALLNCGRVVFCDTDDMGNIDDIKGKLIFKYNAVTEEFEDWNKRPLNPYHN